MADLHLQLKVGSDVALLNGLMNIILTENLQATEYIESCTVGFEELKAKVMEYPPERASEICGISPDLLRRAARVLVSSTRPAMLMYTLGITEHTCGVNNVLSCANLQMLLGNVGFECGGVNPLRGQNNVQGACDMGALPNVYPGYQKVEDPASRAKFEEVLGRRPAQEERLDDSPDDGRPALDGDGQGLLDLRREHGQHRAGHQARRALPRLGRVPGLQRHLPHRDDPLRRRHLPGGGLERERGDLHQLGAPGQPGPQGGRSARKRPAQLVGLQGDCGPPLRPGLGLRIGSGYLG